MKKNLLLLLSIVFGMTANVVQAQSSYSLTFYGEGLTDNVQKTDVAPGDAIEAPELPQRLYYTDNGNDFYFTFAGWYSDYDETVITDFTNVQMPSQDVTFYATWTYTDTTKVCVDRKTKESAQGFDHWELQYDVANDDNREFYENHNENFDPTMYDYEEYKPHDVDKDITDALTTTIKGKEVDSITFILHWSADYEYKYTTPGGIGVIGDPGGIGGPGGSGESGGNKPIDLGIMYLDDENDSYTIDGQAFKLENSDDADNEGYNEKKIISGTKKCGCDSVVKFKIEQTPKLTWYAGSDGTINDDPADYDHGYVKPAQLLTAEDFNKDENAVQKFDKKIKAPTNVTREGFKLTGWVITDADGNETAEYKSGETVMPTTDIIFTAQWKEATYTLTWLYDGTITDDDYTKGDIAKGTVIKAPKKETISRSGFTFVGWVDADGNDFDESTTMPDHNLTYYAKWKHDDSYTICLNSKGGSNEGAYDWYIEGFNKHNEDYEGYEFPFVNHNYEDVMKSKDENRDSIIYTLEITTERSYISQTEFSEWVMEGETMTLETTTGNVDDRIDLGTFYLKDDNDSKEILGRTYTLDNIGENEDAVPNGETVKDINNVEYTKKSCDMQVKFVIAKLPTLTWNGNGGKWKEGTEEKNVITKQLEPGEDITAPAEEPKQTGYTFNGWNTVQNPTDDDPGNRLEDNAKMPTTDLTYYAQWTTNEHTLTWDFQKGETETDVADYTNGPVKFGTSIVKPEDPARPGYKFDGWDPAVAATMPDQNVTYTAQWEIITYKIEYVNLEGATHSNPATYTVETATFALANPGTRAGYTFTGWTCGGNAITQIAVGSTGDKTITANWEEAKDVDLYDNREAEEYQELYEKYKDLTINVTLKRSFANGQWTTLALPFTIDLTDYEEQLNGRIYSINSITADNTNGIILHFSSHEGEQMKAGVPYLFKPDEDITDLKFKDVQFESFLAQTLGWEDAEFRSTMSIDRLRNRTSLYITNNRLYYANQTSGTRIRAFRGYIELKNQNINYVQPRFLLPGMSEAIEITEGTEDADDIPATAVKYIQNDRLVIELNGIRYNATGNRIK